MEYFTQLTIDCIDNAKYAILPGDPKRAKELALCIDPKATKLKENRQHASYLAYLEGTPILVISTGMGCPAIHAVTVELSRLCLQYLIRIGTCGAIKPNINLGDIIFTKSAVKLDGVSKQYIDVAYPAIASYSLTQSFVLAAKEHNVPHHIGITATSDTFWPGQERLDNFSGYLLRNLQGAMKEWQAINVSNFEMEASALLTAAHILEIKAACFCGVLAKRVENEEVSMDAKEIAKRNWETILKPGLLNDIKRRAQEVTKHESR
ncbi:MAG: uridine phosphorylase [Francisella sp.]|jgi:uridine phosphorylase